jgi:carbon-monoxide dehydrogenase small subunit
MKISEKTVAIQFMLNGKKVSLEVEGDQTALETIRDRLLLKGTKEGCGIGECGACTIVVDGRAVNACLMLAAQLDGREVSTVEGLAGSGDLNFLQASFLDHHGVQCGFCTPGILMSTYALFRERVSPRRDEIIKAISGNLCRCTGYGQIVTAIEEGAARLSRRLG